MCRALVAVALATSGLGANSADLIFDASPGTPITTSQTADTSFWIGVNNSGVSVVIGAGGSVTVNSGGNSATLGNNASSAGNSLVVSGLPSGLTVGETLYVGYGGAKNTMTIGAGATATAKDIWIGGLAGSTGNSAWVTGTGSLSATNSFILGYGAGSNALTIQTGGTVNTTNDVHIGFVPTATTNSVTISDAGSVWSVGGTFYAGSESSSNSLVISAGGKLAVDTKDLLIGATTTTSGADGNTLLVTGTGSLLSNTNGTLYVGRGGSQNSLQIKSGATASTKNVRIGGGSGATGTPSSNTAVVDGAGSVWNVSGTLRVGAGVAGTASGLDITNGGVVNVTGNSFLGYDAITDNNYVYVDGAGSKLNAAALTIGNALNSTGNKVRLSNGGTLAATSITIGDQSGLEIGNGGPSGSIPTPTTLTGSQAGAYVRFNHTDADFTFASTLAGTLGVVHDGTGFTTISGTASYTGATTVNAGVLQFDSTNTSTAVTVNGGMLRGTGSVGAVTLAGSGRLSPGASPGVIRTGNLSIPSGTFYDVEITGPNAGTGHDQADVTGTVTLGGQLSVTMGYFPPPGSQFVIIANDGNDPVNGTFSGLPEGATLTVGDLSLKISYVGGSGNDVVLTAVGYNLPATPVPVGTPASLALLGLLLAIGAMATRRLGTRA